MSEELKFCPECQKEGKKSVVYPNNFIFRTAAMPVNFFDEDGKFHCHDGNNTSQGFSCSNGHKWKEESSGRCWCGWPDV